LHIIALFSDFKARFIELLLDWTDDARAEVSRWPSTGDVGLTPYGEQALRRAITRFSDRARAGAP
ncbi:MAG: hypothetical protein ACRD0U_15515, partial [Acidimicrobiales bacterium]